VIACLFTTLPATSQVSGADISKDEYEVVSIALGKRTQRVFLYGATSGHMLTLRDAVRAPKTPLMTKQGDSALTRPRREPNEAMKEHFREEKSRLEDAEAFKARISVETIDDWMEKNADSYEWENQFDFAAPTVLLSSKLNQQLPSNPEEYWNELRTRYPALIAIDEASRVGFNRARTQAVVLVGFATSVSGGEGEYVLLEKQSGRWRIAHRMRAWLS